MKKILYLTVGLIILVQLGFLDNPFASMPEFSKEYGDTVVLYATSWCGYCAKARDLLNKNDIDYLEYDIEASSRGRDEYDQLGGNGVPLLLIGGEMVEGYNPDRILMLAQDM